MDDKAKISQLQNNDGDRYTVTKSFDFSKHSKFQDDSTIVNKDWARLHMTEQSMTLGNETFNLVNDLTLDVKVDA